MPDTKSTRRRDGALSALREADFDWVKRVGDVWVDDTGDVPNIHSPIRERFARVLSDLSRRPQHTSPLGWVVQGPGGSGKTHLLGHMRSATMRKGGFFVMADMTGLKDFWTTLLLHTVESLRCPDEAPQIVALIGKILGEAGREGTADDVARLAPDQIAREIDLVVKGLYRGHKRAAQEHQDVVRALFLLASDDLDASNCGWGWLQGLPQEREDLFSFGFKAPCGEPRSAVEGLSWLMSLGDGFSVLAMDQLDGFASQYASPDGMGDGEREAARFIMSGLCDGLSALVDLTRNCQVVLSCLEATWEALQRFGLKSSLARFEPPVKLPFTTGGQQAARLITGRMLTACRKAKFTPPHPTWPFAQSALKSAEDLSPREILFRCHCHARECVAEGRAYEALSLVDDEPEAVAVSLPDDEPEPVTVSFSANEPEQVMVSKTPYSRKRMRTMDERYARLCEETRTEQLRGVAEEDGFWKEALSLYARAFIQERPEDPDRELVEDSEESVDANYPLLHARLRFIMHDRDDRERQFGLRAILRQHGTSFRNRLDAAMKQSGIGRDISFRRLSIVHFGAVPGGPATQTRELIDRFREWGGVFVEPDETVVRRLAALRQLKKENPVDWIEWVQHRRPTGEIGFLADEFAWLVSPPDDEVGPDRTEPVPGGDAAAIEDVEVVAEEKKGARIRRDTMVRRRSAATRVATLPVGRRLVGDRPAGEVGLVPQDLTRHVAILGGTGSGKTVLTRRIVEEAVLLGIPSIVVDVGNDLASLGSPFPRAPEAWREGSAERAKAYFSRCEVVVWTPGRVRGNPLRLRVLPDFADLADDAEELEEAISMTVAALRDMAGVRPGKDKRKEALLTEALRWQARNGGGGLTALSEILRDLPGGIGSQLAQADKLGRDMFENIAAEMSMDPTLADEGAVHDVSVLLRGRPGRTRVSVVNLSGLNDATGLKQQMFVNQLIMNLFSWIKKNPSRSVGGLLVVDEAREFIPAVRSAPCKEAILRFGRQARKYGFGMVIASQEPKSVDHNVINNCNTQFYGKQNSLTAQEAAEKLMENRGRVGKLPRGVFYVKSDALDTGAGELVKVEVPLCLSRHSGVLPPEEILGLAEKSREKLG